MRRKHLRVLALAAALAVLGLGGVWWKQAAVEAAVPEAAPAPPLASAPSPAPQPPLPVAGGRRAWEAGALYRYAASADLEVAFGRLSEAGNVPGANALRFTLRGDWEVGVVAAEAGTVQARVQLRPTTFELGVEGQGAVAPEARQAVLAMLSVPFFLTLDTSGAVRLTHFEQGVDELARGLLRALVAASQFVVTGAPPATWNAEEQDTSGHYVAVYRRLSASRFEKRKQAYTAVATQAGLRPPGTDLRLSTSGSTTYALGEDLWPRTLQARERLTVDSGEGMPTVSNALTLELRLLELRKDPSLPGALAARQGLLGTSALASFAGQPADPLAHHRQVLGQRGLDDILAALRALPEDEKARENARTQALEQLRALFMLHPAEALKVPGLLRSGLSPEAASAMLGALSAASTPEALQALVQATADTSLTTDVRMDAVSALGMAGEPNREGVDALRMLARDPDPRLRSTASLAFGNAAFQLGDTDARGAEALVQELKSGYRAAATPEQQALLLRSLGNTRAPDALDVIADALRSDSPRVRESALVALRNIPSPEADRLLAERLLTDPVPEVRRGAVFACGFRPLPPLLPALEQALQRDTSDGVRGDIVQLLGHFRGTLPQAMALLRWASQNERNPEIRRMATTFVDTPTEAVPSQPGSAPIR